MTLTHDQAHFYLQHQLDASLAAQSLEELASHLAGCAECRAYASQLQTLHQTLGPALEKRWQASGVRTSVKAVLAQTNRFRQTQNFTPRLAWGAMTLMVGLILFGVIYSSLGTTGGSLQTSPMPPIQTPLPRESSALTIAPATATNYCTEINYVVQEGDTLPGIAQQFGISEQDLRAYNPLAAPTPQAGSTLRIPACAPTPNLSHTPTFTMTPALTQSNARGY